MEAYYNVDSALYIIHDSPTLAQAIQKAQDDLYDRVNGIVDTYLALPKQGRDCSIGIRGLGRGTGKDDSRLVLGEWKRPGQGWILGCYKGYGLQSPMSSIYMLFLVVAMSSETKLLCVIFHLSRSSGCLVIPFVLEETFQLALTS